VDKESAMELFNCCKVLLILRDGMVGMGLQVNVI
jgi:hypothetical protein